MKYFIIVAITCLFVPLCLCNPTGIGNKHTHHSTRGHRHPLCTDVKKIPGMENGAFITRDDGSWQYRVDGSREYTLDTCRLKRFTPAEARQCLAGHHMLWIGDSVSRYQFLVLAYFLEHGTWPPRFGMPRTDKCEHIDEFGNPTCSPADEPSVAMEGDWSRLYGHANEKSWKEIHRYVGGAGFHGNMECDCARGRDSIDNMYYNRSFDLSDAPVALTFLGSRGSHNGPIWGHKSSSCAKAGSCDLTSAQWDTIQTNVDKQELDWKYYGETPEFFEALDAESIAPGVDIAIFNQGLWGRIPVNLPNVSATFEGLFNVTQKHKGKCFWKGTTAAFSGATPVALSMPETFPTAELAVRNSAYAHGCGVYDLSHVTKEFTNFQWNGDIGRPKCCGDSEMMNVYWDAVHFLPWVYEEFNQILLNVLC